MKNIEDNVILGIIGNKFDLYKKEQIKEEKVRDLAKEIGLAFNENRLILELINYLKMSE